MRLLVRPVHTGILLLLTAACGESDAGPLPAAPPGYPYAYASNSCGPADGPATRFYLAAEPSATLPTTAPRIEFAIHRSASELQGEDVAWDGASGEGWAGRCDGSGPCTAATSAVVRFRRGDADTVLSGTVQLRFEDGTSASGGFEAVWRRTEQLCG
jgi:hypothetical protein